MGLGEAAVTTTLSAPPSRLIFSARVLLRAVDHVCGTQLAGRPQSLLADVDGDELGASAVSSTSALSRARWFRACAFPRPPTPPTLAAARRRY